MRRVRPNAEKIYAALGNFRVDLARLQPWFRYPRLSVAELEPPAGGRTSWDFSAMDPIVIDFMQAAGHRPVMLNLGTIPQWMFKTDKPVSYPADADEIAWNYAGGTELRDPTLAELTDYYRRPVSWYAKGSFEDEYGRLHSGGQHFKIDYWEMLNEPDLEQNWSPEQYTRIYDAVVAALRPLDRAHARRAARLVEAGKRPHQPERLCGRRRHAGDAEVEISGRRRTTSERPSRSRRHWSR
jgi:hypothetical protein